MIEEQDVLVCWHSAKAQDNIMMSAVNLLEPQGVDIKHVVLLINQGMIVHLPANMPFSVHVVYLDIAEPNEYRVILNELKNKLPDYWKPTWRIHIDITPGTSAMSAVWTYMFAKGLLPEGVTLWYSKRYRETGECSIDKVDLE